MKQHIRTLIRHAAKTAFEQGRLPSDTIPDFMVEEPKLEAHGDFSTNLAMAMASVQKMSPRKIAEALIAHIQDPEKILLKTEIAGPGFINFFIAPGAWHPILRQIHEKDEQYGASDIGKGQKIQIEFVSANPTGPLHFGHGRGAAVGDSVANILAFCGYDVHREYYINDSGRQITTLGRSVFLRYKEILGENIAFPEDCYQGDYIRDLAQTVKTDKGDSLLKADESEAVAYCARYASDAILKYIRQVLEEFGVGFDQWYSEQKLCDSGKVEDIIREYRDKGLMYEKEGALWFKTSDFGDEKDRVVVRANGQTTYFASDIAYHIEKFQRGFDKVIDVWGADHHGYIPRVTAALEASGQNKEKFQVILIYMVNLFRDGQPVAMSKRSGEFITLKDVVDEVGKDAARFIFLTRHYESPLDFDLELAKKKTNDNPVFYVQYVHARISSIIAKSLEMGIDAGAWDDAAMAALIDPEDIGLIKAISRYPEVVKQSAQFSEPHRITYFLMNLSAAFHAYYNRNRVLGDDPLLSRARLYLISAVKKTIRNGLKLLGVSAPEKM
jgi:arginyl-tRNA synthetase